MRLHRSMSVLAVAAAASLSLAACGSSGSSKPKAASTAPIANVASLTGQQTAVTLNTDTIKALTGLGVKVGPTGTAHAVNLADGDAIAFPITGGHVTVYNKGAVTPYVQGSINHNGSGLSFTVGSKVLDISNFVVDPGASVLTGTVGAQPGSGTAGVPLFRLDGSALQITTPNSQYHLDGTVVKLLPSAASAIDKYFGVPDGTIPPNAVIGTAHIVATA